MAREFLAIRNWAEYQHYKERNPPWLKLHVKLMTSIDWVATTDQSRVLMIALMTLAARHENRIPFDPVYIKRVCYLNNKPDFTQLLELQFIEKITNSSLASNVHTNASDDGKMLDQRQSTETEEEADTETPLAASQPILVEADSAEATVKRVWEYYVKKLARTERYQLTTKRKAKGMARYLDCMKLARGQPDQAALLMKQAVDALASSQFHRDGGHIDWEDNLFKSTEKLQWWLDKKQQVKANGKTEQRNSEIENARGEAAGLLGLRRNSSEVLPDNPRPATIGDGRESLPGREPHPRILDGGIRVIPRPERQPVSPEAGAVDRTGEESESG